MTIRFSGDDLARAFGQPIPSTRCATCRHPRLWHWKRRPNEPADVPLHGCRHRDARRKTNQCPCDSFVEPEAAA